MSTTRRLHPAVFVGILLLALLYTYSYFNDAAAPANHLDPLDKSGWLDWGDQGFYFRSARALAAGDFDPRQHWYPLGYAILAAPFAFLGTYQFFFIDLFGLIVAYLGFIAFAARLDVSPLSAALLFLAIVCTDPVVFRHWAIPWSTTPAAAIIWAMLAVTAAFLKGDRRPLLLGLLAGLLPLMRPTDGIVSAICLGWAGSAALLRRRQSGREIVKMAAGVLLAILPYAALYLLIYGPNATQYMLNSRQTGFTLHNPLFRAYVLLIEPRQWFFTGAGLLQRIPWLLFGFAGAAVAWRRGSAAALLAVCLVAYLLLFVAYVDLLPTGLWRYNNIHYFKWTLPGFGLLGWFLLRDIVERRRTACAALAAVFLVLCIRVAPRAAGPAELAVAVDLRGAAATEATATMKPTLAAEDSAGPLFNMVTMRAFPLPADAGVRLIAIRRDFIGTVTWAPDRGLPMAADLPPQLRWAEQIGFGYPCWLPPRPCKPQPPAE